MAKTKRKSNARPQFWQVLIQITKLAILIDIALFCIFYYLDSPIMAWFNVFSISCYAGAYFALKRRRNGIATRLMYTEVISHIAAGVLVLGWESGFAYYLIMFIPAVCLSTNAKQAIISLICLFAFIAGLNITMVILDPIQPIDDLALKVVHLANLALVFSMLSYLSFFYLGKVRKTQEALHRLATTDSLTKLLNRRQITNLSKIELNRDHKQNRMMSLILLDLDHFKVINDTHGHEIGDQVLIKCSSLLKAKLRSTDLLSRWGGEEFLIVMPNISFDVATNKAESIRKSIKSFDWHKELGVSLSVTLSGGLAEIEENESLSDAIRRADKALYESKRNGRDRIELALKSESK